jgi:hypothetical protein
MLGNSAWSLSTKRSQEWRKSPAQSAKATDTFRITGDSNPATSFCAVFSFFLAKMGLHVRAWRQNGFTLCCKHAVIGLNYLYGASDALVFERIHSRCADTAIRTMRIVHIRACRGEATGYQRVSSG